MNLTVLMPYRAAGSLRRMIDRPAREALLLGREHPLTLAAPALAGLALIGGATVLGGLLAGGGGAGAADRSLLALLEALAVAFPVLLVTANLAGIRVTPSTLLAAGAISLAVAGVASALMLPLLAFLALCSGGAGEAELIRALLVPTVALCSVVAVLSRVLRSIERSFKARALVWAFGALAAAGLFARFHPFFGVG